MEENCEDNIEDLETEDPEKDDAANGENIDSKDETKKKKQNFVL